MTTINFYLQMAREMDEILKQQNAQRANSCIKDDGASFLDQVIAPLYEVVAAVRFPFFCSIVFNVCTGSSRVEFSLVKKFCLIFLCLLNFL